MPKVKSLRAVAASGVHIAAGSIAEVSAEDARVLFNLGAAVPVAEVADEATEPKPKARKAAG
jgi:hypothetical protein